MGGLGGLFVWVVCVGGLDGWLSGWFGTRVAGWVV